MKPLLHLTMNTGVCVEQSPGDVGDDAISALTPLVKRGGGRLPKPLGAFRVEIPRLGRDAGVVFTVYRDHDAMVTCAVCWDDQDAEQAWNEINGVYLQLVAADTPSPPLHAATMPDRIPWLAEVILPGIVRQPSNDVSWLKDFERCLAFAIMREPLDFPRRSDDGGKSVNDR
jgi:hypothetical protein